jgi:hypothetical protein
LDADDLNKAFSALYRAPIDYGGALAMETARFRDICNRIRPRQALDDRTPPQAYLDVTQRSAEGPVTATRHRAGLTRHPVIELAGGGSQRRSCAGGDSHVRQLGRRRSAPLDMAGCRAATRSW